MSTNLRKIAVLCTASASAVEEDQLMKRKLARAQLLWHIIVVTSLVLHLTSAVLSAMDPGVNITLYLPSIPYR